LEIYGKRIYRRVTCIDKLFNVHVELACKTYLQLQDNESFQAVVQILICRINSFGIVV